MMMDVIKSKIFLFMSHPTADLVKEEIRSLVKESPWLGEDHFNKFREHIFPKLYFIRYNMRRGVEPEF